MGRAVAGRRHAPAFACYARKNGLCTSRKASIREMPISLSLALIELGALITLGVRVATDFYKAATPLLRRDLATLALRSLALSIVEPKQSRARSGGLSRRADGDRSVTVWLRQWRSNPVGRALLALWGDAEWIRRPGIHEGTGAGSHNRMVAMPMVFEYQIDSN
jgi:hypothetical protein